MISILDFLRDPQNRAVLSWIGGGLSGLFGLILTIRKRGKPFAPKTTSLDNKPTDHPETSYSTHVSSDVISAHSAVVITRGGTARDVKVGYGLTSIFFFGLIILFIGLAATIFSNSFKTTSSVLPKYDYEVDCSGLKENTFKATLEESNDIQKLYDFASQNDGRLIYFTLNIIRWCAGCSCFRAEYSKHDFIKQNASWDGIYIAFKGHDLGEDPGNQFVWPQDVKLNLVDMKHLPFPYNLFFPKSDQIPSAGFYSINQYGSYMFYQGPFVIHSDEGTGYRYVYLSPVIDDSINLENRIDCTLNSSSMSFWDKLRAKCL